MALLGAASYFVRQWLCCVRIRPDVISYNAAITACEKRSLWEAALQLFDSIDQVPGPVDVAGCQRSRSALHCGTSMDFNILAFQIMLESWHLELDVIANHGSKQQNLRLESLSCLFQ